MDAKLLNTAQSSLFENVALNSSSLFNLATQSSATSGFSTVSSSSLLFIDSRIDQYQSLLAGVTAGTEVVVLDPIEDAITQITNKLLGRTGIESLQILSHGAEGGLLLGNAWIDNQYLTNHAESLAQWANSLTADADILLYGCDVGRGEMGQAFVQILSQLTSADVAASDDRTGNSALGGDWELEVQTGEIGAKLAFKADVLQAYQSVFATYTGTQNLSTTNLSENVTIVGDTTLNITGNFTIGNGFTLSGDNVGAADSLTIKATGTVNLGANLQSLGLQNLKIEAQTIILGDGVQITLGGDLTFTASATSSTLTGLIPIAGGFIGSGNEATITLGSNVNLQAAGIQLNAKAEDVNPLNGINNPLGAGILKTLVDYGTEFASLPVSVMIRQSKANITIGNNSQLTSAGDVDITANAVADATSKAISQLFSLGWSDATASAITNINQGVTINAAENVTISADASATAKMTTRTLANLSQSSINNAGIAVSLAIASSDLTAKTTINQGANITAGRNANILANGKGKHEASAEAGAYNDGKAGISAGLNFSKADVQAVVNGKVTANTSLQKTFNPSSAVNTSNDQITISNHTFKDGQAIVYSKGSGTALGGLEDGKTYFVIVVDANTIKLAESASDAGDKKAIDLTSIGSGTSHVIKDPGLRVVAQLASEDKGDATSGVGGEVAIDDNFKSDIVLSNLFQKLTADNAKAKEGSGGSGSSSNFGAAGAVGFAKVNHTVEAKIGSTGILQSNADVYVKAAIENKVQTAAEASSEPAENASAQASTASVAVAVGLFSNSAKATVEDGATIDAKSTTSITSEVSYPFLTTLKEHFDIATKFKEDGLIGLTDYLDGTLGFKSSLFNSWAKSTAKGNNLGLAGSVNYLQFTNLSQATVGSGAKINQNVLFQTDAQAVAVEATTEVKLVNVTGVFDFELTLNKLNDLRTSNDRLAELNPAGSQSGKGGMGGSFFLLFNDSTTIAKVANGAQIRTGSDGDLSIKAESKNIDINVAQSGASGGKFAVGGTFAYTNQTSLTLAQLESGVQLTGGALNINANDETTRVNAVGGVAKGNNVGVGLSVSLNEMQRETYALIGNRVGDPVTDTGIDLSGDINVAAKATGGLWSFSLAAAVASKKPGSNESQDPPAQPSEASDDPLDGVSLPILFGEMDPLPEGQNSTANTSNDKGNQGKSGIGISGDVSINTATDKVSAFINDAGSIKAAKVKLDAQNDTVMRVASGSAAIASADPGKTSVGIAGSFSMNTLTGTTSAYINGASTSGQKLALTADSLELSATRSGDLFALSASGSGAAGQSGYAVSGSVSLNKIANTTTATISGIQGTITNQVSLKAKDNSRIFAIGGAASFGGKAGVGAAIGLNRITNTTKASVQNSVLDYGTTLDLSALNDSSIKALAAAVAASTGSSGGAGAGTISINIINNTTEASISGTQKGLQTPTGAMTLLAKNNASIEALAGAVGLSGGTGGVGAAVAYNGITNNTQVFISNSNLITQSTISLAAETTATIKSLTLGVGGGKSVGLGGSVAINLIRGGTRAYLNNNTVLVAGGQISLRATDSSTIEGLAGGIAGSQTAAIGASIAVNDISTDTRSYIEQSNVTSQNAGVSSIAQGSATIKTITVGGAGAQTVAIGGSVSVNLIRNTVDSHISSGSTVNAAQTIEVKAIEASTLEASGGALAGAGTAAVAGAFIVNDIANNVTANIAASTVTSQQSNVIVSADSQDTVRTISVGGAGGGTAGVAGSVSVSMMDNTVAAEITGSTVTADDNVMVLANSQNTIDFYGGTISGGGTAGVGGSANVNTVSNTTKAAISGTSNITAKGNADSTAPKADGSGASEIIRGVAVVATSNEDVNVWTANLSGGGTAGVAATASVTVLQDETLAYIDDSSINSNNTGANADQAVRVRAFNNTDVDIKAGTATIGGTAGVGATVDVTVIGNTTKAYINNATIVNAQKAVEVTSFTRETLGSIVASGAGGGTVGVAGSVLVSDLRSTNQAFINNSTVNTFGNLRVVADDRVNATAKAGAVGIGIGAAGVGGTVSVITINNSTTARISNSTTNASGLTEVKANSVESVSTMGATGAGGFYVGAAGTVLVSSITSKTLAYIDGTSQINTNAAYQTGSQDVKVDAQNRSSLTGGVATLGGGAVGFGASVMVSGIWNTTSAYVGDGVTLKAGRDLQVNAFSEKTVTPTVLAFSGGIVGVSGAVSVVNIGGGMTSDGTSAVSDTNSKTNEQTNKSQVGNQLGSSSYATRAKTQADNSTVGMSVSGSFGSTAPVVNGTSAFIGANANITTGGKLDLKADERITVNQIVGRAEGGLVSVGGSVAIVNANGNTQAFIGAGTAINAGGDVNVTATYTGNQTGFAAAGSGGLVSLGAQVVLLNDNSNQAAYLGTGARINQANTVQINAIGNRNLTSTMASVAVGGVVAGAAISRINAGGSTSARVGDDAQIGQTVGQTVGNLSVSANSDTRVVGEVYSLSAGIGAGSGNDAKVNISPTISAGIGAGADVKVTGNINLAATGTAEARTNVAGVNAGGLAIGVSLAESTASPTFTTSIGSDAVLEAGQSINLDSRFNVDANGASIGGKQVKAEASSSGGGLLSGNGADARATTNATLNTTIGDRANLKAGGDIRALSRSSTNTESKAQGNSYGAAAVGASIANANETINVSAKIGNSAILDGQNLQIQAQHQGQQVKAEATSSTGGLIGAVGSRANAGTNTTVIAETGSNPDLKARGNVNIRAQSSNVADTYASGSAYGAAALGSTSVESTITNTTRANVGDGTQINAGQDVTISAQSDNRVARAEAVGGAGGIFAGASTSGKAVINDNTTASVGDNSRITALNGTIKVEALASNEAHSKGTISTGGAVTDNTTDATSNVTSHIRTEVGDGAQLLSKQIQLHAKGTKLDVDADAYSKTIAANSTTRANSNLNIDVDTKVTNYTGASLNGENRLEIVSRLDGVDTDSKAKAEIEAGLTGSVYATAHNDLKLDADIDIQSQSQLSSSDILIEAISPQDRNAIYGVDPETVAKTVVNYILTAVEEVVKVVGKIPIIGWFVKWVTRTVMKLVEQILNSETEAKRSGNFHSYNTINLGGDIYQGAPSQASLLINPDLTMVTQGAISAQIVGNEVIVSDVTTKPPGQILINSAFGSVTGNATIHKNSVLEIVDIINNSNKDLRINRIKTINNSVESPDLDIRADSNTSQINTVTDVLGAPRITIQNNTGSNVIFAGQIENSTGRLQVTNQGGHILSADNVQLENASASINAIQGRVGDLNARLNLRLFDEGTNAALQANAGQTLYLNTQLSSNQLDTGLTVLDGFDFNSITAGQDIDITVQTADIYQFDLQTFVLSRGTIDGIYNLKNVASTQGNVKVSFNQGTVNVGQIQAQSGTMNLSTVGQLVDANSNGSDITAQNAILQATAGVGSAGNALDTTVARLEATGSGGLYVNNVGNLTIGGISPLVGMSMTGDISVTNAGSITFNEDVVASGTVSFTATDTQNPGEDIEVANGAKVQSTGSEVNLLAGDNFKLNPTGTIAAATQINIRGDFGNADAGIGSTIDLRGTMAAPAVNVFGAVDNDTINLTNVTTNAPVTIQAQAGDDLIRIGSQSTPTSNTGGTVNQINALLNIDGGTGNDQLQVDETGDAANNTGTLTQNSITGLGMAGSIQYGNLEAVEINLGSGSDTFTIASTHNGTTNVNANIGQDTVNVQTIAGNTTVNAEDDNDTINIGNSTPTVNQIAASLTIIGGIGSDQMNVNDSGDTTDNTGVLTQNTVTGLGMTSGIQYSELEDVNLNLGSGNDTFTIASTHTGSTTLNTGAGQDTINAQSISGATTVNAGLGDDTVNASLITPASSGVFVANGDDGNDTLNASASTLGIILNGDAGNDILQGGAGNDQIGGGAGDDTIDGNAGNDTILGDSTFQRMATTYTAPVSLAPAGNDTIQGGAGMDTIYGEGGNDILIGGSVEASELDTTDYIFGGAGNDTIAGDNATINAATRTITQQGSNGATDYIFGDQGTLTLADSSIVAPTGTSNAPVSQAESASAIGDGDDVIAGGVGNDVLMGGTGADQVSGNQGDDRILGDNGRMTFNNGQLIQVQTTEPAVGGNDILNGNEDNDLILGGAGNDTLAGNDGADILLGDNGTIDYGSDGNLATLDVVTTTNSLIGGTDILSGDAGKDILLGGAMADTLGGGTEDDILLGDHGQINFTNGLLTQVTTLNPADGGDDILSGNAGDDILIGGAANDTISGNTGIDFIAGDNAKVTLVSGVLQHIESIDSEIGGNDTISGNEQGDFIIGGAGADLIDAGSDLATDVVLGDNGVIVRADGSPQANDIYSTDATIGGKDTITGGQGDDILLGGFDNDQISGNEGNDLVLGDHGYVTRNASDQLEQVNSLFLGNGGDDNLSGNAGDDILIGGTANDTINGNLGRDFITGDNTKVTFASGIVQRLETADSTIAGNDIIDGNEDGDFILGGSGNDQITGGADLADDVLLGDNGFIVRADGSAQANDISSIDTTNDGQDTIDGNGGNDIILGGGNGDRLVGSDGNDIVLGDHGYITRNNLDVIELVASTEADKGGNDTIEGNNGNDVILGGFTDDTLNGNAGDDFILGDSGFIDYTLDNQLNTLDVVRTTQPAIGGNDIIMGDLGNDVIFGGAANDNLTGNEGQDILLGDNGELNYVVDGNAATLDLIMSTDPTIGGNDSIQGNQDNDILIGGAADDTMAGNAGNDIVIGDGGRFTLQNGQTRLIETIDPGIGGNDKLSGDQGDDILLGGMANDFLYGNEGNDRILGDNGRLDYAFAGDDRVGPDTNLSTLDVMTTTDPTLGGSDTIFGGLGDDTILGGTDGDSISGDLGDNSQQNIFKIVGSGDFDGDGRMDVLWRNTVGANLIGHMQNTDLISGGATNALVGNWQVAGIADFNQDGKDDIVWRSASGENQLWLMNGNTVLSTRSLGTVGTDWQIANVKDMNSDGKTDIFWRNANGSNVIWNMNSEQIIGTQTFASVSTDWSVGSVADFNGDGKVDILWRHNSGVNYLWYTNGNQVIGGSALTTVSSEWSIAGTQDFNGDGKADILWHHVAGLNVIWLMDGSNILGGQQLASLSANWRLAGLGEFNLDGNRDILWTDDNGNHLAWLMNSTTLLASSATTSQSDPSIFLSGTGWSIAGQGDFDQDGKVDFLWRNATDGQNVLWLMDGQTVIGGGSLSSVGPSWTLASVSDFDGDRKLDLLWRDTAGNTVLWLMDGQNVTGGGLLNPVGSDWQIAQVADFNGDGKSDIFWRHNTGQNVLWFMNGTQILGGGSLNAVGTDWQVSKTGDFNGDGKSDIFWRHNTGQNVLWFMNGTQILGGGSLNAVGTDWQVAGVGDFNGDRKSDIFWRHSTGQNVFWFMDGTQIISGGLPPAVDNSWVVCNIADFNGDGKSDIFWRNTQGVNVEWFMNGAQIISGNFTKPRADDVILGDHGRIYSALPKERNFFSIDITNNDLGGNDTIFGNEGDDFILGQQGNDTIFGGAGEDDITGGHNVLNGADGNDFVDGGSEADVILGDNGTITRRSAGLETWQRYAAPFADVIRDVVRFDDADRVAGDDWLRGGSGDDIIHGQRGNDTLEGNAGDDELYGELGNDNLQGGDGQDSMLGDTGVIVRDYNADGTPRRNLNGSWHRDVILTDVAKLNGTVSGTQSSQFQAPDMLLVTGAMNPDGSKVTGANGWQTPTYEVELLADGNDSLDGGNGDDSMFGQRGNDVMQGGFGNDYLEGNAGNDIINDLAGDDFIIGDDSNNLPPLNTELPIVTRGIHVIDQAAGLNLNLGLFGTVITPNITLITQANSPLLPTLSRVPNLPRDNSPVPIFGNLVGNNGTIFRPLAAIVPDTINHLDLLSGNDQINAGAGLDTVVGDRYINVMPIRTGNATVDQNFDFLTRSLYHLNYDLHDLELALAGTSGAAPQELTLGSDILNGGDDRDLVMGDNALFMGPLQIQAATDATALNNLLLDLRQALGNFNGLVNNLMVPFAGGVLNQPYTLAIGNDQVSGNGGDDKLLADDTFIITPVMNSLTYNRGGFWNYAQVGPTKIARSNIREFNLKLGNDSMSGGEGNDLMVAGYSNLITTLVLPTPQNATERQTLRTSLELLAEDVRSFLRDLHTTNNGIDYSNRNQSNSLWLGNDVMNGDAGNDLMMAENVTLTLPVVNRTIDVDFNLVKGKLDYSNEGHNFFQGLPHQYDLNYRNPSLGFSQMREDWMNGGDGNDIMFGMEGIDQLLGGSGDDYLFGGADVDTLTDTVGNNVLRSTNPSPNDLTLIDPSINLALSNLLSPALQRYFVELDQTRNSWPLDGRLDVQF